MQCKYIHTDFENLDSKFNLSVIYYNFSSFKNQIWHFNTFWYLKILISTELIMYKAGKLKKYTVKIQHRIIKYSYSKLLNKRHLLHLPNLMFDNTVKIMHLISNFLFCVLVNVFCWNYFSNNYKQDIGLLNIIYRFCY